MMNLKKQLLLSTFIAYGISALLGIMYRFQKFHIDQLPYFNFGSLIPKMEEGYDVLRGIRTLLEYGSFPLTYFLLFFVISITLIVSLKRTTSKKVIRGTNVVTPKEMRKELLKQIKKDYSKSDIKKEKWTRLNIGKEKIPLDYLSEPKSTLILGSAGSGKTRMILSLMEQISTFKETMIIYEIKDDFVPKLYREDKDFIFFPAFENSIKWNLLSEVESEQDIDFICSVIIPPSTGKDDHWDISSIIVLKSILLFMWHNANKENRIVSNKELIDFIIGHQSMKKLKETIGKSEVAQLYAIDLDSILTDDNQGASLWANMYKFLSQLKRREFYYAEDNFSIKKFIMANRDKNIDSRLFIVNTAQANENQIYFRLFLSLMSRTIRTLPNRIDRRLWLFVDEAQSLGKATEILNTLPATARSKGASVFASSQSINSFYSIYGRDETQEIFANYKTKILFALRDTNSTKFVSDLFSSQQIEEVNESFSEGYTYQQDRVNLSTKQTTQKTILESQILALPDNKAFISVNDMITTVTNRDNTLEVIFDIEPDVVEKNVRFPFFGEDKIDDNNLLLSIIAQNSGYKKEEVEANEIAEKRAKENKELDGLRDTDPNSFIKKFQEVEDDRENLEKPQLKKNNEIIFRF